MAGGRPSKLSDPSFLKLVAELFAAGASRADMCEELGMKDKDTITRWRRDPRVKARVAKINEDRVIQISRKVDSIIEGRLAHAEEMDTETLLRIRKEYGGAAVARKEAIDDATVSEALDALEQNPDLDDELRELLEKADRAKQPESPEPQE